MNKFGYTVGNYVNINNVPKKIIGLTETHAIYYHDGCELHVPFEEIEPILIDCDLLRKLGWIGDSSYLTIRIDDNSYFQFYMYEKRLRRIWKGKDEWQNHSHITDILFQCHTQYLHQLQNALVLAGNQIEMNVDKIFKNKTV